MSRRRMAPINHASAPGMGQKLEGRLHGGKDIGYIAKDVMSGTIHDVNAYQRATEKRQRRAAKALKALGKETIEG